MSDLDKTTEELIPSINDSAKHVTNITITFLATCIYIAIAVASTRNEMLLLGSDITLPLLNVKVPLLQFYWLAPFLIALLHLHLRLQEYFLFCKLEPLELLEPSSIRKVALHLFPALPVNSYLGYAAKTYRSSVRIILRILRYLVQQVLPLALLCGIQLRFLPYHSTATTAVHQMLVIADVLLISYYARKLSLLRKVHPPADGRMLSHLRNWVRRIFLSTVSVFSLLLAVVPGTSIESLLGRPLPLAHRLPRNLSLSESRFPEGINLRGRDLRGADFTEAYLVGADLRGADLRDAILVHADVRGAKLMPAGLSSSDRSLLSIKEAAQDMESHTRLDGAQLREADLRGANLILANLSHAQFDDANLAEAVMIGAMMSNALLRRTDLRGAEPLPQPARFRPTHGG